jgi:hypothetical protein
MHAVVTPERHIVPGRSLAPPEGTVRC